MLYQNIEGTNIDVGTDAIKDRCISSLVMHQVLSVKLFYPVDYLMMAS